MDTLNTQNLQQIDKQHHLHPFSDAKSLNQLGSRVIEKAQGVYIWDSNGEKIIDGMAGLWCVNIGYGCTELSDAAYQQMNHLPYYNTFFKTTHPKAVELSKLLSEVTPKGLNYAFFNNSGSEAIDSMIKLARRYWQALNQPQKNLIIARNNAYHGSTVAGALLGGMGMMQDQTGNFDLGFRHIMQPHWYKSDSDLSEDEFGLLAAKALEQKIIELGAENVAAFVGEPIQGAGGVIIPPKTYWPEIQKICKKYDVLVVADEVICGFGRTGEWFGSDYFGIEPDLMTMAKGLSSGYIPISAVMLSDKVSQVLIEKGGEFAHGYTYSAHPVACAVAIKNIQILQEKKIVEKVKTDIGPYFQSQLKEMENHPLIGHTQGVGLIGAMQMVKNKKTRELFKNGSEIGDICRDFCFKNNLIMRACGDRLVLSPSLIINHKQVDEIFRLARLSLDLTLEKIK